MRKNRRYTNKGKYPKPRREPQTSAGRSNSMTTVGIKIMVVLLGFHMLLVVAGLYGYPVPKGYVYAEDAVLALGAMLAAVLFGSDAMVTGEVPLSQEKYLTLRFTGAIAAFVAVLVLLRIYHT